MKFFASFHEFYNMGKKNRGVKKSHQTKNLKFANIRSAIPYHELSVGIICQLYYIIYDYIILDVHT